MLLFYPLPPPPLSMRAQFCRYLKLLNATIIRKVACVDGRTVMPRALSWPRRPRGIWLVPNIYAAQPLKNIRLSPANCASYAGYRKATRKGKKAKQRFEVKPGNLPRNLPSLLLDRKKQREISSSPRTSKEERKEEGMSYSPLGRNLWLCPLPTFLLPRKNCSSGTSSAIEASLINGQLHSGDTKFAVLDKCSQNLRFWYLYSQNICLGPEGVSWIVGTGIRVRVIGARAGRRSIPCWKSTYRNFSLTVSIQDSGFSNSKADSTTTRIRFV